MTEGKNLDPRPALDGKTKEKRAIQTRELCRGTKAGMGIPLALGGRLGDLPGLTVSREVGSRSSKTPGLGLPSAQTILLSPLAQGLTQTMQRHVDPEALQRMVKCATQDYTYKGSIPGHPYFPEKYWLSQEEDKCSPNYLCSDRYTWRTGPYNSNCWNKYPTYLPRLPKEAGMETAVRGMPLECPPKPERLNAYEREVVVNMLNSLSRNQPRPQITPRCGCVDPLPGRLPFQGYESACSGRHYCLRGMDHCVTGAPCSDRRLRPLCGDQPTGCIALRAQARNAMCCYNSPAVVLPMSEP
ncbi:spermatid-specific manchette-related protein 1 isoform X2 [Lemur catta]|uniref:spermatid-specific manchette-related protein 1 isoform X2 n=1 Tax=Lemur catta TaxID=9447 RepID=UPI001E26C6BC|nr:spermatid-specific manchette-related protein 1 isoform X2 [Lemur catta]XP_045418908.1 spermatid-specific manchette-related protein 1 isoform X2 [Lemur catta]